jgi:hypothetical protein
MTLETNRYQAARRLLQQGRREWVLVIAGELLRSGSGRALGLRLLEEMYPDGPQVPATVFGDGSADADESCVGLPESAVSDRDMYPAEDLAAPR